jgi:LCP family protein required for cell wall assembly
VASLYTSAALLARVTPALFPGTTLSGVLPDPIPAQQILAEPDESSVFNRPINILVLGLDSRPQQEDDLTLPIEERYKARTDTIMVASVDPITDTITFLSFPRDMVITVHPPNGQPYDNRINESFLEGLQSRHSVEAGAEQVQRDLQRNFGIETDYWLILDFRGVAGVIDAIGGIDVDIPEELAFEEWWYSDDDVTHNLISIPPGRQSLDGYMAVAFSRNRDPNDLARIERQQIVLQAAVTEVFAQGLLSPGRWPRLWEAYRSSVKTDVPNSRLPGYANLVRETRGNMSTFSIADPVGDSATVWDGWLYGASVLYWEPANVRYWIARAFPDRAYANATVEIQNARGVGHELDGLAVGQYIEFDMAVPTVRQGPDAPEAEASEILLYDDDRRGLAEDIARELGLPEAVIRELPRDSDSLPDVRVILATDAELPASDRIAAGG